MTLKEIKTLRMTFKGIKTFRMTPKVIKTLKMTHRRIKTLRIKKGEIPRDIESLGMTKGITNEKKEKGVRKVSLNSGFLWKP
ncbi:hypothetical protein QI155_01090 [Thermodesulfovibrio sp. 1176]|uniref:hypothetical protein n=1 Tax=Thermodesulfovibrio sp. 1176 TaxID=3043424 RepID=UPI0024824EF8|nr:hypothetical protein [Thermodesulfovibrio sp. 1176]MDI1471129.1 hypothetical protein [Thermodesulfovibrio sp. 1176]